MRNFPFPDKISSREELTRDLLYHKIRSQDLEKIADRAWETGVAAARALIDEYGRDKPIESIAGLSGLSLERIGKDNVAGNVRYFSEYYSGRSKIVLYLQSIGKWAKANHLSMSEAEELILSHEYYHFLECTKLGLTSKQYQVPTVCIGPISLGKSGIRALSEIGAHGFSRTYFEAKGKIPAGEKSGKNDKLLLNQAVNAMNFEGRDKARKINSGYVFNLFKENLVRSNKK